MISSSLSRNIFYNCSHKTLNSNNNFFFDDNDDKVGLWSIQQIYSKVVIENNRIYTKPLNEVNSNIKQKVQKVIRDITINNKNIIINKHFSTLQNLSQEVQNNKKQVYSQIFRHIQFHQNKILFIQHFEHIFHSHKHEQFNGLKLFIGDYNDRIVQKYPSHSFMTLQQICALYPQKVPLSYRNKNMAEQIKKNVQERLNKNKINNNIIDLSKQPKFSQIIIINQNIKMWDQAIQIMLDQLPIKITMPYHISDKDSSKQLYHKLSLNDFINGFRTVHSVIHPQIKLNIQQYNLEQFIQESIKNYTDKNRQIQIEIMDNELIEDNHNQRKINILL